MWYLKTNSQKIFSRLRRSTELPNVCFWGVWGRSPPDDDTLFEKSPLVWYLIITTVSKIIWLDDYCHWSVTTIVAACAYCKQICMLFAAVTTRVTRMYLIWISVTYNLTLAEYFYYFKAPSYNAMDRIW